MTASSPPRRYRILFLVHCAPRPDALHGGGRAIASLLAGLAERHRVAVVYLRDLGEPPMDGTLRRKCELVEEVSWVRARRSLPGRIAHRLRVLRAPFGGTPRWVATLPSSGVEECLRAVLGHWSPDLIQLEFSVMGRYLPALAASSAPRLLTHHMPGEDSVGSGGTTPWWTRLGRAADIRAWRRFEQCVMAQVDAVATFSAPDRRQVLGLRPDAAVYQVPLSLTLDAQPLDPIGEPPPSIVFVGNYGHPPNVDAADRLARAILPRVHQRFPQARLYLVGDRPPPKLRRLAGRQVIVTGRVPDVAVYLNRAAVVAAPVRIGGGVRVKVLEALAAGKALVASPLAVEGLSVVHGEHVLIADADADVSDAIATLLADPTSRAALARRARAWAGANLGRERAVAAYEEIYSRLLPAAGRKPAPSPPHPSALEAPSPRTRRPPS